MVACVAEETRQSQVGVYSQDATCLVMALPSLLLNNLSIIRDTLMVENLCSPSAHGFSDWHTENLDDSE